MAEASDGELVARTRQGDREAYGTLVARYQGHVYALAYGLVDNWAEAQDITQEAFIRAYVNLEQLRDSGRFAAWLRRVAFSVAMKWLKAYRPGLFRQLEGRASLDALEIPDFRPGPPEVVERRELAEAVQRAIAALPSKYRLPLTMFHLDGLSYQKVADFLDIPLGTVKSLIHRARERLRDTLAPFAAEEMGKMVQEVLDEHRLPEEFARKVLENVPALGWGRGRECTFAGALAAALAATEHPYEYSDIMGLSGLAFRVRWHHESAEARWCPSCAVGEMPEEIEAVERATGWGLRVEVLFGEEAAKIGRLSPEIVKSINTGWPVLAYDGSLDMGVVYGYEDRGEKLLLRSYSNTEGQSSVPPSGLGGAHHRLLIFLTGHGEPLSPRAGVAEALKTGVRNWRRVRFRPTPVEYWYGEAAYARWIEDLGEAEGLSAEEKQPLCWVNRWNFLTLQDAREAAATFLSDAMGVLSGDEKRALRRVGELYREEAEMLAAALSDGEAFSGSVERWGPEVRERERETLTRARELESGAIVEVERALEGAGSDE